MMRIFQNLLTMTACWLTVAVFSYGVIAAEITPPKMLIDGWSIELFDAEPNIVTPTACDVDAQGNLFVVECHTHFPPEDYVGPDVDRVYLYQHGSKERSLFYEGGVATMSLVCGNDGWVYVSTRSQIIRLKDTNGDYQSDLQEVLIRHETEANYPHNGLSSLYIGQDNRLMFGQGENFGEPYEVIGTDGSSQKGGGEGGNLFTCNFDGSDVQRYATGFWNPFGLTQLPQGDIFCVDNDPDATPPNRLLWIQPRKNYGFEFRFGRAGTHPLLAWNGSYPGTTGMIEGVGEAACAVEPVENALWVTSWGDNRIERISGFSRQTTDAGATAVQVDGNETIVQGNAMFRPVDFAQANDGTLYVTDWVDRSYSVHRKGRIWKLTRQSTARQDASQPRIEPRVTVVDKLAPTQQALEDLHWRWLTEYQQDALHHPDVMDAIRSSLASEDRWLRLYGVRWAAETKLKDFLPMLEVELAKVSTDEQEFAAIISAISFLRTGSASGGRIDPAQDQLLASIIVDPNAQLNSRISALKRLSIDYKFEQLQSVAADLLKLHDSKLSHELIVWLGAVQESQAIELLKAICTDADYGDDVRADAFAALAARDRAKALLAVPLDSANSGVALQKERVRVSGAIERNDPATLAKHKATLPAREDATSWNTQLTGGGDVAAGWRVWTRSECIKCHAYQGRGATVGPELTDIGSEGESARLLQSILQPSREVAPLYVTWQVLTTDGKVVTGSKVNGGGVGESARYLLADGSTIDIAMPDIEEQKELNTSIMPEDIVTTLTIDELRDLLAFLRQPR